MSLSRVRSVPSLEQADQKSRSYIRPALVSGTPDEERELYLRGGQSKTSDVGHGAVEDASGNRLDALMGFKNISVFAHRDTKVTELVRVGSPLLSGWGHSPCPGSHV